jgi:dihydrofolate reductase
MIQYDQISFNKNKYMKIALLAVLDQANGIGKDNKLLCYLPADLRRFKQLTTGHSIIMGRKTFESLPNGPLPNRKNIIITRDKNFMAEGCTLIHSVPEAYEICKNEEIVFVIGGGQIYQMFFQYADILHITRIHHIFDADTFFPEIKNEEWFEESKTDFQPDEKNKYQYSFIDYFKKN